MAAREYPRSTRRTIPTQPTCRSGGCPARVAHRRKLVDRDGVSRRGRCSARSEVSSGTGRRRSATGAALVALALASSAQAATPQPVQNAARALVKLGARTAVVVVVDHGRVHRVETNRAEADLQPFRISSITKTFTATIVLQLVEEGSSTPLQAATWIGPGRRPRLSRSATSSTTGPACQLHERRRLARESRRVPHDPSARRLAPRVQPFMLSALARTGSTQRHELRRAWARHRGGDAARVRAGARSRRIIAPLLRLVSTRRSTTRKLPGLRDGGTNPWLPWAAGSIVSDARDLARFCAALLGGTHHCLPLIYRDAANRRVDTTSAWGSLRSRSHAGRSGDMTAASSTTSPASPRVRTAAGSSWCSCGPSVGRWRRSAALPVVAAVRRCPASAHAARVALALASPAGAALAPGDRATISVTVARRHLEGAEPLPFDRPPFSVEPGRPRCLESATSTTESPGPGSACVQTPQALAADGDGARAGGASAGEVAVRGEPDPWIHMGIPAGCRLPAPHGLRQMESSRDSRSSPARRCAASEQRARNRLSYELLRWRASRARDGSRPIA